MKKYLSLALLTVLMPLLSSCIVAAVGAAQPFRFPYPQKWKTPVGSGRFPVVNLGVVGVF